jgi:hypothetical protein
MMSNGIHLGVVPKNRLAIHKRIFTSISIKYADSLNQFCFRLMKRKGLIIVTPAKTICQLPYLCDNAPQRMLSPEPSNPGGNWQVIGFCFLPLHHTVAPYYLFAFWQFEHVFIWIKYANMTMVVRVGLYGSALFGY